MNTHSDYASADESNDSSSAASLFHFVIQSVRFQRQNPERFAEHFLMVATGYSKLVVDNFAVAIVFAATEVPPVGKKAATFPVAAETVAFANTAADRTFVGSAAAFADVAAFAAATSLGCVVDQIVAALALDDSINRKSKLVTIGMTACFGNLVMQRHLFCLHVQIQLR